MPRGRHANGNGSIRFERLEVGQRETNRKLDKIDRTLETSSRLFELMHERLEHLEKGQDVLVEGQRALVEGQKQVILRLDRLVKATLEDRTRWVERFGALEHRVEIIEKRMDPGKR